MTADRITGEREETAEQDAERQAQTERLYLGKIVERLMKTGAMECPATTEFLKRMDLSLNVLRHAPVHDDVRRLKTLAWAWRREMRGSALALTLNPNDPIVREMGLD